MIKQKQNWRCSRNLSSVFWNERKYWSDWIADPTECIEFSLQVKTIILSLEEHLKTVSFSLFSYSTVIQSALILGTEARKMRWTDDWREQPCSLESTRNVLAWEACWVKCFGKAMCARYCWNSHCVNVIE